jgi:hypothetical protein
MTKPGLHLQNDTFEKVPPSDWMLASWRARGMPEAAIRKNGTLRVKVLRAHGWDIVDGVVLGPKHDG